jgi:hypothetical protein
MQAEILNAPNLWMDLIVAVRIFLGRYCARKLKRSFYAFSMCQNAALLQISNRTVMRGVTQSIA